MEYPRGYNREHFLADMVNKRGYRRMAELGLWKGRTFLHVLAHCPDLTVYGVDTWAYRPQNEGIPGAQTYETWNMAGLENHVRRCAKPFRSRAVILKMDTSEAAEEIPDESLDIIFIDADHSEDGVRTDIRKWRAKVRKGGVIAGHDIDWPTVRKVVEEEFQQWLEGPDNLWWIENDG